MKKSKELSGLPIIALHEGKEIGKIRELIIDPQKRQVVGFLIEDSEWFRNPKTLLYSSIKALGDDAVIVETGNAVSSLSQTNELESLLDQKVNIIDTRCISSEGRYMGRITEFLVDTKTGRISTFEITSPSSSQKPIMMPVEGILTVASDFIITEEPEKASRLHAQTIKPLDTTLSRREISATPPAASQEMRKKGSEPKPDTESSVRKILEERQDAYLVGKEVRKDVAADDGTLIIKAGDIINPEIIEKAKQADKYLALSFSIRRT